MNGIFIFKNGSKEPARIQRMFGEFGPYMLEGRRLDLLTKVQMLVDSSTSTTVQTGISTSTATTGNMVKRAVVGGILLGGVGALAGGVTGKRESEINSTSTESIKTELTAELIFKDGTSQYVFLTDMNGFHWLLEQANQESMSDAEIKEAEQNEKNRKIRDALFVEIKSRTIAPPSNQELLNKFLIKVGAASLLVFIYLWVSMGTFWGTVFLMGILGYFAWLAIKDIYMSYLVKKRGSDATIRNRYFNEIDAAVEKRFLELNQQIVKE